MADARVSRRQFFGTAAAAAVVAQFPTSATPADPKSPPLAPEPPLPAGVCRRLGSARFRELFEGYRFSPDSRWLAEFVGRRFVAYEVATGGRVAWEVPEADQRNLTDWVLTNGEVVVIDPATDANDRLTSLHRYHLLTGRPVPTPTPVDDRHLVLTADGTGVVRCADGPKGGVLWRTDLRTGKTVWKREWKTDASVPAAVLDVTGKWIVAVGAERLHLFDPATGADGPKLDDAGPKDAPPDNHFVPLNFSADGKRLAARYTAEVPGRVVVWDLTSGKVVGRSTPPAADAVPALAPGGDHLLAAAGPEHRLVEVDVRSGKVTRKLAAAHVGDPHRHLRRSESAARASAASDIR